MSISDSTIKELANAILDKPETTKEILNYGTVVDKEGELFVKLDGSEAEMPAMSTVDVRNGDRVTVRIENHQGVILGCTSRTAYLSVEDLYALQATIGGFHITENSIYAGTKDEFINNGSGLYMDSDGKLYLGDPDTFLSFNGDKLELSGNLDINATQTFQPHWIKKVGVDFNRQTGYFSVYTMAVKDGEDFLKDNPPIERYNLISVGPSDGREDGPHIYTDRPRLNIASPVVLEAFSDRDTASGTANTETPLKIGNRYGEHLTFDTNEIIAKSDEVTPGELCLQLDGGKVSVGRASSPTECRIRGNLNIVNGNDSSATDKDTYALKIGNDTGARLMFDSNEIMAATVDANTGASTPSILHLNADGGTVTIGYMSHDANLSINGHPRIGANTNATTSTAVSIPNNAWTEVTAVASNVTAGEFVLVGSISFAAAANGRRAARLVYDSTNTVISGGTAIYAANAQSGAYTVQVFCTFSTTTNRTIKLQAYQSSGAAINVTSAGLKIMRIC